MCGGGLDEDGFCAFFFCGGGLRLGVLGTVVDFPLDCLAFCFFWEAVFLILARSIVSFEEEEESEEEELPELPDPSEFDLSDSPISGGSSSFFAFLSLFR